MNVNSVVWKGPYDDRNNSIEFTVMYRSGCLSCSKKFECKKPEWSVNSIWMFICLGLKNLSKDADRNVPWDPTILRLHTISAAKLPEMFVLEIRTAPWSPVILLLPPDLSHIMRSISNTVLFGSTLASPKDTPVTLTVDTVLTVLPILVFAVYVDVVDSKSVSVSWLICWIRWSSAVVEVWSSWCLSGDSERDELSFTRSPLVSQSDGPY